MSFYRAWRGDLGFMKHEWKRLVYDFDGTCERHGRNHGVFGHCEWLHLNGFPMPNRTERRTLVRRANKATKGRNRNGDPERYTDYEARETIKQVAAYQENESRRRIKSFGLAPMIRNLRKVAKTSKSQKLNPPDRRLLLALADVAEMCGSYEFSHSTRKLGEMADISAVSVSTIMHKLDKLNLVRRNGRCKPYRHLRGTSKFTLMPREPEQRRDERKRPVFDLQKVRWVWQDPADRGVESWWAWHQLRRAASLPYVRSNSFQIAIDSPKEHQLALEDPSGRGSP